MIDHRSNGVGIIDGCFVRFCSSTRSNDGRNRFLGGFAIGSIVDRDHCSVRGEQFADPTSDSSPTAGHQSHPTFELMPCCIHHSRLLIVDSILNPITRV